jgi:hypothetical protein
MFTLAMTVFSLSKPPRVQKSPTMTLGLIQSKTNALKSTKAIKVSIVWLRSNQVNRKYHSILLRQNLTGLLLKAQLVTKRTPYSIKQNWPSIGVPLLL